MSQSLIENYLKLSTLVTLKVEGTKENLTYS